MTSTTHVRYANTRYENTRERIVLRELVRFKKEHTENAEKMERTKLCGSFLLSRINCFAIACEERSLPRNVRFKIQKTRDPYLRAWLFENFLQPKNHFCSNSVNKFFFIYQIVTKKLHFPSLRDYTFHIRIPFSACDLVSRIRESIDFRSLLINFDTHCPCSTNRY